MLWYAVHIAPSGRSHLCASCRECWLLLTHISNESFRNCASLKGATMLRIMNPLQGQPLSLRNPGTFVLVGWKYFAAGCPVLCRRWSSVSGLHALDASITPPPVATTKNVSRYGQVFFGGSLPEESLLYLVRGWCRDTKAWTPASTQHITEGHPLLTGLAGAFIMMAS